MDTFIDRRRKLSKAYDESKEEAQLSEFGTQGFMVFIAGDWMGGFAWVDLCVNFSAKFW